MSVFFSLKRLIVSVDYLLQSTTGEFSPFPVQTEKGLPACRPAEPTPLAGEPQELPQHKKQSFLNDHPGLTTKRCVKCLQEKDKSQFNKRKKGSSDGLQSYCIECQKSTCKFPDKPKRSNKHGYFLSSTQSVMTANDYERMYKEQDGKCLICGNRQKKLHIDHDHQSGYVRGLLCQNCNVGIGNLKDDPVILRRAALYIIDAKIRNETFEILALSGVRL